MGLFSDNDSRDGGSHPVWPPKVGGRCVHGRLVGVSVSPLGVSTSLSALVTTLQREKRLKIIQRYKWLFL